MGRGTDRRNGSAPLRARPPRTDPVHRALQEWEVNSHMLLPTKTEVASHLAQYRAWERLRLAAPADRQVRAHFEDTAYTLCVLMGKRCGREAADAAERYLRPSVEHPPMAAPPLAAPAVAVAALSGP